MMHETPRCAEVSEESKLAFFSNEPDQIEKAISICNDCPIRMMCLENALKNKEARGVRGGVDAKERRRDQAMDVNGDLHIHSTGPIRCPNCGPQSTKYLYTVEKKRKFTVIACINCGLKFPTLKIINKAQNNF